MYYLFLAEGFEETEALATLDVMRRAKLEVKTVGITGEYVTGSHNVTIKADIMPNMVSYENMEGVVLPGGMPGTLNLEKSACVTDSVRYCHENGKIISAICAAPSILGHMGILKGKKATCFPGFEQELDCAEYTASRTQTDKNVVTGKGAGCAVEFGHAIVSLALSKADADKVLGDMQCF